MLTNTKQNVNIRALKLGYEMHRQKITRTALRALPLRRLLASRLVQTLAYPHGVDRYLVSLNPAWSIDEVRARIVATRQQTPASVTVTLAANENWRGFAAGQYVRVTAEVDGVRHTRCFSPTNASAHAVDGMLELTCRIGPRSIVARHFAGDGAVGEIVRLSPAQGTFLLPETRPPRVLFISGGSGITPVMAMLRTLLDEGYAAPITFLHYARSAAERLYAAELAQLAAAHDNLRILWACTQTAEGELRGHFDAAQLDATVPKWTRTETFLCGPAGLTDAVTAAFTARRSVQRLHVERFATAPIAAPAGDARGEVRFARSERVAAHCGMSLLAQAQAAGLHPECGCRMGICHSCTTRKLSGRVCDLRNGELSGDGEEDIQICVCVPVGTVTLAL